MTDDRQREADAEGLRRYLAGEPLLFSTGIHQGLTWGYGELDVNGFWEHHVPFDALRPEDQARIRAIDAAQSHAEAEEAAKRRADIDGGPFRDS